MNRPCGMVYHCWVLRMSVLSLQETWRAGPVQRLGGQAPSDCTNGCSNVCSVREDYSCHLQTHGPEQETEALRLLCDTLFSGVLIQDWHFLPLKSFISHHKSSDRIYQMRWVSKVFAWFLISFPFVECERCLMGKGWRGKGFRNNLQPNLHYKVQPWRFPVPLPLSRFSDCIGFHCSALISKAGGAAAPLVTAAMHCSTDHCQPSPEEFWRKCQFINKLWQIWCLCARQTARSNNSLSPIDTGDGKWDMQAAVKNQEDSIGALLFNFVLPFVFWTHSYLHIQQCNLHFWCQFSSFNLNMDIMKLILQVSILVQWWVTF